MYMCILYLDGFSGLSCLFCQLTLYKLLYINNFIIFIGSSRPPSPASFSLEGRKPAEVSCPNYISEHAMRKLKFLGIAT